MINTVAKVKLNWTKQVWVETTSIEQMGLKTTIVEQIELRINTVVLGEVEHENVE